MTTPDPAPRIPAELLRAQAGAILRAWGLDEADAATTAEVLVDADLKGIESHGTSMLEVYAPMVRAGQIRLDAKPRILRESASTALVDGMAAMGHPTGRFAMDLAIRKAEAADVGVVAVRNANHFGACGTYAERAVRRGLIAMVSCATRLATVVPTGGATPMLGTNPFAFAAPAGRHPPVVLDMATSVVPSNRIRVYGVQGKGIPAGWVVDGEGRDVTDAELGYRLLRERVGGLTPLGGGSTLTGGHKGYGLGLFAQILGATLAGASFTPLRLRTQGPADPDDIGLFFLALNPAAFRPLEEFTADLDDVLDTLREAPRADPAQPVRIPGDPEWEERARREATGLPMAPAVMSRLRAVARDSGCAWLLGAC
ncbi:Ldh family oxidoreductase [Roseomonas sp. CCTCC AB2023176]|uniref:Ldh family oxidoreductase n=1 Tax=Roseomonas sp. CCTCC AB2023176 TaxID=3342640 RepID=UPI0035D867F4